MDGAREDVDVEVETRCWEDKCPGIVQELCVSVGMTLNMGDVVCLVDCSADQQRLSLLKAADSLAFASANSNAGCELNDRFQNFTEKLVLNMASGHSWKPKDMLKCCSDLERVVCDFMEIVKTYGKLIISEMHFPPEQKTVRPVKIGGVLGGAKYIVRGVLFKIPDGAMFSSYDDPMRIANKVQGHELKGLKSYFGWFFNRGMIGLVSFPLTAIVDFKGYRITAMTLVPISGSRTLIYGSNDAGSECNVKNEIPEWSDLIFEASLGLNLKPHHVVNGRLARGETEIASCIDLEGHKGRDGRFYLLDFSRSLPPAFKEQRDDVQDSMWPYYNLMRSEFVKRWEKPLSADAFSNFQSKWTSDRKAEAKANQDEIRVATNFIKVNVVAKVCRALLVSHDASTSLRQIFHREGLNMRYLGLVYQHLVGAQYQSAMANLYKMMQIEALMRVLKADLRNQLRLVQAKVAANCADSALLERAAVVLNQYFCGDSAAVWMEKNLFCMDSLVSGFNFKKSHASCVIDSFLDCKESVSETNSTGESKLVSFRFAVFRRLCEDSGVMVSKALLNELERRETGFNTRSFLSGKIFVESDIRFEERVKHLDIVERARGLAEYLQGESMGSKAASEHMMKAFGIFEVALERSPLDAWLSLIMGNVCSKMFSFVEQTGSADKELRELFSTRAEFYYRQASVFEKSLLSSLQLGKFLLKLESRLDEAEEAFRNVLELGQTQGEGSERLLKEAITGLLDVLERKGLVDIANELREVAKGFMKVKERWMGRKIYNDPTDGLKPPGPSLGRNRSRSRGDALEVSSSSMVSTVAETDASTDSSFESLIDGSKRKIVQLRRAIQRKAGDVVEKKKSRGIAIEGRNSLDAGRKGGFMDTLRRGGQKFANQFGSRTSESNIVPKVSSEPASDEEVASNSQSQRSSFEDDGTEQGMAELTAAAARNHGLEQSVSELALESTASSSTVMDDDMQSYLRDFVVRRKTLKLPDMQIEKYKAGNDVND